MEVLMLILSDFWSFKLTEIMTKIYYNSKNEKNYIIKKNLIYFNI